MKLYHLKDNSEKYASRSTITGPVIKCKREEQSKGEREKKRVSKSERVKNRENKCEKRKNSEQG